MSIYTQKGNNFSLKAGISYIITFLISRIQPYKYLFTSLHCPFHDTSATFPHHHIFHLRSIMDTLLTHSDSSKPNNSNVATPTGNHSVFTANDSHHGPIAAPDSTLGRHVARRLVQIGVEDVFSVPGDFNLTLLDHLIAEPGLNNIGCCNELNAGYAADGYARARGVGACVVTFTVGGLSVLNAIAGACSENLPVICIVGGPNTNDYGTNRILHHTIGLPDFSQEMKCFRPVTCYQVNAWKCN